MMESRRCRKPILLLTIETKNFDSVEMREYAQLRRASLHPSPAALTHGTYQIVFYDGKGSWPHAQANVCPNVGGGLSSPFESE